MTDNKNNNTSVDNITISEAYEKLWGRIFEFIEKLKGE